MKTMLALLVLAQVKPGPEHEWLRQFEGTWDVTTTHADGARSTSVETAAMGCGGRWLIFDNRAEKWHGHGTLGYDQDKKKFVGVWMSSSSTRLTVMEGALDAAGKAQTMEFDRPSGRYRDVFESTGPDSRRMRSHRIEADGRERLVMTIEYVRKK